MWLKQGDKGTKDRESGSPSDSGGMGLTLCPSRVVEESLLFQCLSSPL